MTAGEMAARNRVLFKQMPGVRTMVRHYATILQVGLSISVLGGVAWAADQGTAQERRACTPDVLKHCTEFIPDAERITTCLQEKLRELSPDCRVVMIAPKKSLK
jgi:hypothetical protein